MNTITIVPAHTKKHFPVAHPVEAFSSAYRHVLPESDFSCIVSLIKQGKIKVAIDGETRSVDLLPTTQVEPFLDQVFAALGDE